MASTQLRQKVGGHTSPVVTCSFAASEEYLVRLKAQGYLIVQLIVCTFRLILFLQESGGVETTYKSMRTFYNVSLVVKGILLANLSKLHVVPL